MKFCPKCGTKLVLIQDKHTANASLEYQCSKCGYKDCNLLDTHEHEIVIKKSYTPKEPIVILDEKTLELRTMSTTRTECPKCHNDLAYIWQVQTRSGDEGSTQFFRCTKCNYTWRLYT